MVDTVANVVIAATAFFSAIVGLYSYKKDIKEKANEVKRKKQQDTLEAYNRLQNEVLDAIYCDYTTPQIIEISEHNRTNKEDYHKLGTYIARIEHFCVGVELEIYDWKTLYELGHGFFDGTIRKMINPIIDKKNRYKEHHYYENINKVYCKMDIETERRKNGCTKM